VFPVRYELAFYNPEDSILHFTMIIALDTSNLSDIIMDDAQNNIGNCCYPTPIDAFRLCSNALADLPVDSLNLVI
jgi:hypothetical protein